MTRQWPWQRKRFLCPYCGGCFFTAEVSMDRRPNKMARITSIGGLLTCTKCGLGTGYDDFVRQHRGWLVRRLPDRYLIRVGDAGARDL